MYSASTSSQRLRLAVLFSHPIQYFAPLMRTLTARPDVDLTVYYCSRHGLDERLDAQFGVRFRWDVPLVDGYKSVFLPNLRNRPGVHGFFQLVNPSILTELRRGRYDAILVHGYEHLTKWLAFAGAYLAGTPVILRGDSQLLKHRSPIVRVLKQIVLRPLFRSMSGFAYIGEQNHQYYRYYGVSDERLFFVPYAVDNDFFVDGHARLQPRRAEIRASFGVHDDRPIILSCGKIIPLKQPLMLLRAFQKVRAEIPCALLFAGDGELRPEIERIVRDEQIPDVMITGFLNQGRISEAYTAADMLALISNREAWGLVVNEAMNFGLPVVVSDQVGCAVNLVRPGRNGFIVSHTDMASIENALRVLSVTVSLRDKFGKESLRIVGKYSIDAAADSLVEGIRNILTLPHEATAVLPNS